jgi:DNA primase small subunit
LFPSNGIVLTTNPSTDRHKFTFQKRTKSMPHSVLAESEAPQAEEVTMEDGPVANGDAPRVAEEDVDMADAAPEPSLAVDDTTEEKKEDVKLEDLFADADSDDEFPSSHPAEKTPASSAGEMTPTSR